MYISNTNYTLTGFTQNRANTVIGGSRPWVAFGKQKQWGKNIGSAGNNSISFPLSFTSFATVVATGSDNNYYNYYIASIDTSKFVFWKENSKGRQITWLAAGY